MCLGENLAPGAATYLSFQLSRLYQNAKRCLQEPCPSNGDDDCIFSILASVVISDIPDQPSSTFKATFEEPKLQFICNHNAVLTLVMESVSSPISFRNVSVTFLVPVQTETLDISAPPGQSIGKIAVDRLELESAKLLSISDETKRHDLLPCLRQYLKLLLTRAKMPFLLPKLCNSQLSATCWAADSGLPRVFWNHALAEGSSKARMSEAPNGVTVNQINLHLFSTWLRCKLQSTRSRSDGISPRNLVCGSMTVDSDGTRITLEFGSPRVEILCASEVVIYIDVRQLQISSDGMDNPGSDHRGSWLAAFVIGFRTEVSNAREIAIFPDFQQGFHHQPFLSHSQDLVVTPAAYQQILATMHNYVTSLGKYELKTIYSRDRKWDSLVYDRLEAIENVQGAWPNAEEEWAIDLARKTTAGAFDQVVVLSQESLNAHWAILFERTRSILKEWRSTGFEATFQQPQLRLLSDNRAIFLVYLVRGTYLPLESPALPESRDSESMDSSKPRQLEQMRLAFEVDIVDGTHGDIERVPLDPTFPVVTEHVNTGHQLKHLMLDFENARYLPKYSTEPSVKDGDEGYCDATRYVQSVVVYILKGYFRELIKQGLNVLVSIPVWHKSDKPPQYGMSDVGFQVQWDGGEITLDNWTQVSMSSTTPQPALAIFGVAGRKLPTTAPPVAAPWVLRLPPQFSHGTVVIAKHVFIEHVVLTPLARINALTTFIPLQGILLPGMAHTLDLRSWDDIRARDANGTKAEPTAWKLHSSDEPGYLTYLWEHYEDRRYKCKGQCCQYDHEDTVTCRTKNRLTFLTDIDKGILRIRIEGKVRLEIERSANGLKTSAVATVKWELMYTVNVENGVMEPSEPKAPRYSQETCWSNGATDMELDPQQLLEAVFRLPSDVRFSLTEEGENARHLVYPPGGAYSLGNRTFNNNGDLIFELLRRTDAPPTVTPLQDTAPALGSNGYTITSGSY